MLQIKLKKSVGKNSHPNPTDVIIVQTCLSNIKVKTKFGMKPLWQGKVDGKNSKDLVCAIENFQCSEKLRVTGKIDANTGQTLSKLRQRTPATALNKLTENNRKAVSFFDPRRVVDHNKKLAKIIINSWSLPKKEAESVAKLVIDIAQKSNTPLNPKPSYISIDASGKFEVRFEVADLKISQVPLTETQRKSIIKNAINTTRSNQLTSSKPHALHFKTKKAYKILRNLPSWNSKFLEELRIRTSPNNSITKSLLTAIAINSPTFGQKGSLALMNFRNHLNTGGGINTQHDDAFYRSCPFIRTGASTRRW